MTDRNDIANAAALAELAIEYWKLLRNYDHVIAAAPEKLKSGLTAQANFGARRLNLILDQAGMHVETFEGQPFSPNLPLTAVNAEDFADIGTAVIDQTLEPTIISGTTPVRTGRVYLKPANPQEA